MQTKYKCPDCGQFHYETEYWFIFENNSIKKVTYTLEEATAFRKTLKNPLKTSIQFVLVCHVEGDLETAETTIRRSTTKKQRMAILDWISEHIEANTTLQDRLKTLFVDPENNTDNA